MIISWFTQPPSSFSSYYQYDTVTQQFSRIRLELGRSSPSGSTNDTLVSYKPQRSVGFADQRLSTSDPGQHWSVNEDGALCYDEVALPGTPRDGVRVYDSSDPSSFVHRGNPVTESPTLPAGIEAKHLALLANRALATGSGIKLTGRDATPEQLADAIKGEVCDILGVREFAAVNDDLILSELTSQVKVIQGEITDEYASSLDKALTSAKDASHLIAEQIEEGILTPTEAFETAFGSLQSALAKAQTASGQDDVQQALTEIGKAQNELDTAVKNIDTVKNEATAKQLELARESLSEAQQHATGWQEIEEEYEPLAEAETIEDYEREIGIGAEEFV